MNKKERKIRKPTRIESYLIIILMLIIIGIGASVFDANIKILLIICAACNLILAWRCGYTWQMVEEKIGETVGGLASTIVVMLGIGFVISTWMFSGTAPALVYWLGALVSPNVIMVLSFVLTGAMSLMIGSSFATMGTLGIVLFSAGIAQGLPAGVMAATVICGANVGQYLSPLADCVSYNAGINKISIYKHIKMLAVPVIAATVLTIIFYVVCGFSFTSSGTVSMDAINALRTEISQNFNISILCVVPLLAALALCFLKTPPALALFSSGFSAIIIGMITQKFSLLDGFETAWSGFNSSILNNSNISEELSSFLNRGGSFSLADSIFMMVIAMITIDILGLIGVFDVIRDSLLKNIQNARHLTITTALFSSVFTVITTNSWTSCAVTTEAMKESYHKAGYVSDSISAVTAACTYMVEQFLPWAFLAIYSASVYGVTVTDYVPWAVFFPFVTVITIIYYSVVKLEPYAQPEERSVNE